MGIARIFQKGGHTEPYRGYSPDCHLNIVGCMLTKRFTKGGLKEPQDPPPQPSAMPLDPGLVFMTTSSQFSFFSLPHVKQYDILRSHQNENHQNTFDPSVVTVFTQLRTAPVTERCLQLSATCKGENIRDNFE